MPQGGYTDEIKLLLERVRRAPLKPHQRNFILRTHILLRFNHRMFEKVTCKILTEIDVLVRESEGG